MASLSDRKISNRKCSIVATYEAAKFAEFFIIFPGDQRPSERILNFSDF